MSYLRYLCLLMHSCVQRMLCCVVLLSLFAFIVLSCDVRYDFCIKRMFGSSLPPAVCRRAYVLFTLFVFAYA